METWQIPTLGFTLRLKVSYQLVLESIVQGLKHEGFAVVTEIDLQETLKRKLNVDTHPFKVMRVYHPVLSARALSIAPQNALLPYNLTLTQLEDGEIELGLVDPLPVSAVEQHPELVPVISQAYRLLRRVVESLPGI